MNPVTETLLNMRLLLSEERHWTRLATARDGAGCPVAADHPNAEQWCLIGACWKCGYRSLEGSADHWIEVFSFLEQESYNVNGTKHFDIWQDKAHNTHKSVLGFLEHCIKESRKLK